MEAEYMAEQAEWERDNAERLTVASYRHSREYGGPEEGGWYYDYHQLVRGGIRTFGSVAERDEWLESQGEEHTYYLFRSVDEVPDYFYNYPGQTQRPYYS